MVASDGKGSADRAGEVAAGEAGALAAPRSQVLALASGRVIEVAPGPGGADVLRITARDGQCVLTVRVTDDGPVLSFTGASLELASAGTLELSCRDLRVRVDGDAAVEVAGDLRERVAGSAVREALGAASLTARSIGVEAREGGVLVKANDDVDIKGERVLLNSDDPPMPLSLEEYRARLLAKPAPVVLGPGAKPPKENDE
jgi:hypothetical protein